MLCWVLIVLERELTQTLLEKDREIARLRTTVTSVLSLVQKAKLAADMERQELEDRLRNATSQLQNN